MAGAQSPDGQRRWPGSGRGMPLPLVGVPGGKQRGGELLDLGDVVARPRFAGRRVDLQRGHVLVEQVLLWSASSSYARPREPAALVSTSSTSVTLRQAATSTPAIRSTEDAGGSRRAVGHEAIMRRQPA